MLRCPACRPQMNFHGPPSPALATKRQCAAGFRKVDQVVQVERGDKAVGIHQTRALGKDVAVGRHRGMKVGPSRQSY